MSELAWAAGFFEAAGTATTCGTRPRLAVKHGDERTVRRFHAAIELGAVYGPYGPYKGQMGNKSYFLWCADEDDAYESAARMLPWLGPQRRAQIAAVAAAEVIHRGNDALVTGNSDRAQP